MLNRIFLSADIEGTCGIAHWDETELGKPDYEPFRHQMTREVAAACEGAFAAGCEDLLIKDAHDSARNLIPSELPERVSIFRGWGSDIHSMMSGIDASFTGAIFTGYHSSSNTDANPLSHTMNLDNVSVRINGIQASELVINTFAAALYDVPVLMVTGDLGVCEQAKRLLSRDSHRSGQPRLRQRLDFDSSRRSRQAHPRKGGACCRGRHCASGKIHGRAAEQFRC